MRTSMCLGAFALAASVFTTVRAEPCSPADLNEDGLVDFADYLEFLNRYDAGDPSVDYTGDGLVDFPDYLEFLNLFEAGCMLACTAAATELACAPLVAYPFADFVNAYMDGTPVSISVDPFRAADLTGKTTRVYITANQIWAAGMPLVDVRGGGFQMVTWPGGSISAGTFALTDSATLPSNAGEDIGVPYDLVIDENANGVFDGCDKVDGAGPQGGFYKFRDITTANDATPVTQIDTVSLPLGRTIQTYEDERWYFPADIASRGRLPLVIIGHGAGHQYIWYDFLGRHLASYGMIVISIENLVGLIPEAAQTTLDHTNSIIALQATLASGVLNEHINQNEIYLIGHSRGGEGVAYAWPLLATTYTPTGGYPEIITPGQIKYVQAIAPINQTTTLNPMSGSMPVDFMLLYGSADGDVCGCPSFLVTWAFGVYERVYGRRNSVYIHGADHNVFNCCGVHDFSGPAETELGRLEAQKLQKALTLASIKFYRNGNIPCGELLWRQYESLRPGATLASATVDYEYKEVAANKFIIDDFQTQPSVTLSSSGGAVAGSITNLTEGLMRDPTPNFLWAAADPMNGMTRVHTTGQIFCAVFDYDNTVASRHYTFDVPPAARDTSPFRYLSFRAAQGTQHPFTSAVLGDQDFEVELEDGAGHASRIRTSAYSGGIEEPYQRLSSGSPGWQNEFETIRIRFADFTADGRPLDLTDIPKVRFLFGSDHGTSQGRLAMDDIEFVK